MFEHEQSTVDYIKANWESYDRLALIYIDRRNGDRVTQKIRTAEEIVESQFQAHLRAANANGQDLYVSMNTLKPEATGRKKADIQDIRHVYIDVDHGGPEVVARLLADTEIPAPHHVLESSVQKYQVIWSVKDFSADQAENLMRGMAAKYEADPAVTDVSRVLRLQGFRNWKYENRHYVRDVAVTVSTQREYTPANFPAFTEQIEQRVAPGKIAVEYREGDRSREDFKWVMSQLRRGADPAMIQQELEQRRQDKPNPRYYARHTREKAEAELAQSQGFGVGR